MAFRGLLVALTVVVGLVALNPAQASLAPSPLFQADITSLDNGFYGAAGVGEWAPSPYSAQLGWSDFQVGPATHVSDYRPNTPAWATYGSSPDPVYTLTVTPGTREITDWGETQPGATQAFTFAAQTTLVNGGGLTLANMLQVGIEDSVMSVSLSGLTPSTEYTVVAYAYNGSDYSNTWLKYESGSWQSLGTMTFPGATPTDTSNSVTFNLFSDANGVITFSPGPNNPNYVGAQPPPGSAYAMISGLQVYATPEPATMALLAIGGIGALLRRRK